ncbi:MAG: right-handed parallel beta-helix repeat-containing protein, partial [Bacteroidota bacterium]
MTVQRLFIALLVACACFTSVAQNTIYVKSDAWGNNDGTTWEDAFTDFTEAVQASQPGDQIWVAMGVYYPSSQPNYAVGAPEQEFNHFTLKNGVSIYGGFTGNESDLSQRDFENNPTVLSGDIDQNDDVEPEGFVTDHTKINGRNSLKLFYFPQGSTIDTTAVLDGFILSGAYADNDVFPYMSGGAFLSQDASPRVTNCSFRGNYAKDKGGAIYINQSSMIIENCSFSGNYSVVHGGAVAFMETSAALKNCEFTNNQSKYGGAVFIEGGEETSVMDNCKFHSNSTLEGGNGGGISISNAKVLVENSEFISNTADIWGGGVVFHADCDVDMINTVIDNNHALAWGGGIGAIHDCNVRLTNTRIRGNVADTYGGGVAARENSSIDFTNVLLSGNVCGNDVNNYTGSAIAIMSGSQTDMYNVTIVNNKNLTTGTKAAVVSTGDNSLARFYNSIIGYNNGGDQYATSGGKIEFYNSRGDGLSADNGNTGSNPLYSDHPYTYEPPTNQGNYDLWGHSTLNNSGSNNYVPKDIYDLDNDGNTDEPIPVDIEGKPRIFAGIVDMGCYEQQLESASGNMLVVGDEQRLQISNGPVLTDTDFTIECWIHPSKDAVNDEYHNICGPPDGTTTANRSPMLY